MQVRVLIHSSVALPPGEEPPPPIAYGIGCLMELITRLDDVEKGILPLPGMEACTSVVQSVASSHTDYTPSVCTISTKSVTGNDV